MANAHVLMCDDTCVIFDLMNAYALICVTKCICMRIISHMHSLTHIIRNAVTHLSYAH